MFYPLIVIFFFIQLVWIQLVWSDSFKECESYPDKCKEQCEKNRALAKSLRNRQQRVSKMGGDYAFTAFNVIQNQLYDLGKLKASICADRKISDKMVGNFVCKQKRGYKKAMYILSIYQACHSLDREMSVGEIRETKRSRKNNSTKIELFNITQADGTKIKKTIWYFRNNQKGTKEDFDVTYLDGRKKKKNISYIIWGYLCNDKEESRKTKHPFSIYQSCKSPSYESSFGKIKITKYHSKSKKRKMEFFDFNTTRGHSIGGSGFQEAEKKNTAL